MAGSEIAAVKAIRTDNGEVKDTSGDHTHGSQALGALPFHRVLVETGLVSEDQITDSLRISKRESLPLERVLVRDGIVMSSELAALLALYTGVPMVDLGSQSLDSEAVKAIPEGVARKYHVLPVQAESGRLAVAMVNPADMAVRQDLSAFTGRTIEPVIATADDIREHIDLAYRLTQDFSDLDLGGAEGADGKLTAGVLRDSPPARVIDLLMRQALQDRSSDIHIEPEEDRLRVRFRIDGILHDVMNLPLEMLPTIISRLKIMSGMNIAERRRPQDGQFSFRVQNRTVDVRAAISGTVTGEMAVLRLLEKGFELIGLDRIGMSPAALETYRKLIRLPYGIIVVCGPTGAGKSTTLYSSITEMDRLEQNVISLEDPVEYRVADTNQMQVQPEAGITFASQLRSVLRLDPDVILVGEIRDQETAVIATQAALTGHIVLTSLHANDAVSAVLRLKDLGVAPYLIASAVAGVVSQRMVRVVCSGCQSVGPTPAAEQEAFASETGEILESHTYGAGCNLCAQTGFRGRTGVFEVMTMSETLRQLILAESTRDRMAAVALEEGMIPLRRDAMFKARQGITTPSEVMRVLFTLE